MLLRSVRLGFLAVVWTSLYGTRVLAVTPLPEPACLEPQVQFWSNIFTKYSVDQVVIHDNLYLDIVYTVVGQAGTGAGVKPHAQERDIQQAKEEVIKRLRRLDENPAGNPKDKDDARFKTLFAKLSGRHKYREAIERVRGQRGLKEKFSQGLRISGGYLEVIKSILTKHNVPEDLAYLPHVESSFNIHSYSKVGAAGIWQFMHSTGKLYLTINYSIDERRQPIIATAAAARLLRHNYDELGSWPLAIIAYNHGLNGMRRAIEQVGVKDICQITAEYESRSFQFASRNFYPEFIAAKRIGKNPTAYFPGLKLDAPRDYFEYVTTHYLDYKTMINHCGINANEFRILNLHLRPPVLSGERRIPKGTTLFIPANNKNAFIAKYSSLDPKLKHESQLPSTWYKVRRGDTLSKIAKQFGVSKSSLIHLNAIKNPNRLRAGQTLKLPTKIEPSKAPKPTAPSEQVAQTIPEKQLESQASQVPAVAEEPAQEPAELTPELPELPAEGTEEATTVIETAVVDTTQSKPLLDTTPAEKTKTDFLTITVRAEERMLQYAEWADVPLTEILKINRIRRQSTISIGSSIRVPLWNVAEDVFNARREEYHESVRQDFYAMYQIPETKTHVVRRGETLWHICERVYDIPMWLLLVYNPDLDIAKVKAGDKLIIPTVTEKPTP